MLVAIEMVSIAGATITIAIWSVAITKEIIAVRLFAIIQSLVGFPLLPGEA